MPKNPHRNPRPLAPTAEQAGRAKADKPKVAEAKRGSLVPKKGGGQRGMEQATAFHRVGVMRSGDRMGARRRIDIKLPPPESPEAYSTMSKARTVRPVMGSKQNFWQQASQKW